MIKVLNLKLKFWYQKLPDCYIGELVQFPGVRSEAKTLNILEDNLIDSAKDLMDHKLYKKIIVDTKTLMK